MNSKYLIVDPRPLEAFKDKSLISGIGLVCSACKGISGTSRRARRSSRGGSDFKNSNVKFKWQVGKEYKISYENASGWASERNIKVKKESPMEKILDYVLSLKIILIQLIQKIFLKKY